MGLFLHVHLPKINLTSYKKRLYLAEGTIFSGIPVKKNQKGGGNMRKIIISLILIGVVAAIALVGAVALFTDTETNPTNSFSTGTMNLGINPATAMFTVSDR